MKSKSAILFSNSLPLALAVALTLSSCKKEGCMDENAYNYNWDAEKDNGSCMYNAELKVNVIPKFNGDPISFDSVYHNIMGYRVKFSSIKFYMTYAKVGDGTNWTDAHSVSQYNYANSTELFSADVTPGSYSQIKFNVGVDSVRNHSDPASYPSDNPLNIITSSGMFWTWNTGYIFVIIEGFYDTDSLGTGTPPNSFTYHLGMDDYLRVNTQSLSLNLVEQMTTTVNYELNMDQFFYNATDTLDIDANPVIHSLVNQLPITDMLTQNFNNSLVLE
ncbi:MAG: MbnP family protein [Crocinitomicaceae bacterium]